MIIVQSPLRITLGGGGTDVPEYFKVYGGETACAAINSYITVTINRPFSNTGTIKYSQIENYNYVDEIQHPYIREALKQFGLTSEPLEIASIAEIPSGTGLGSSGTFAAALLHALSIFTGKKIYAQELAELASYLEIDVLGKKVGKQDQYAAAFGGVNSYFFRGDGNVDVCPIDLTWQTLNEFKHRVLLFFLGKSREASQVLEDQISNVQSGDMATIHGLDLTKELGARGVRHLKDGNLKGFGDVTREHWRIKRDFSQKIVPQHLEAIFRAFDVPSVWGLKLVGAGGGGFLMLVCQEPKKVRSIAASLNLRELEYDFDFMGTRQLK